MVLGLNILSTFKQFRFGASSTPGTTDESQVEDEEELGARRLELAGMIREWECRKAQELRVPEVQQTS